MSTATNVAGSRGETYQSSLRTNRVKARSRVLIREWEDGTIVILYRGRSLPFRKYEQPVAVAPVAPRSEPVHHPWIKKFNKWLFASTNRSPNASV